jgi:hypothetical protein
VWPIRLRPRRTLRTIDYHTKSPIREPWNKAAGHGGTYWEPNGGRAAAIVVAWLDWQLRGDARAARMFRGRNCTLCDDPAWVVQKKRID